MEYSNRDTARGRGLYGAKGRDGVRKRGVEVSCKGSVRETGQFKGAGMQ